MQYDHYQSKRHQAEKTMVMLSIHLAGLITQMERIKRLGVPLNVLRRHWAMFIQPVLNRMNNLRQRYWLTGYVCNPKLKP